MKKTPITVRELVKSVTVDLRLKVVAGKNGLSRVINGSELHRPGLALTGFTKGFPEDRVQLVGDSESLYLTQLSQLERKEALERIFRDTTPCVVITGRNRVSIAMKRIANEKQIPILTSGKAASDVAFLLTNFLSACFAPSESIHGTLVDCYGTGLLFIGRASIGKSEIALDLVERGHRLIADDIVNLSLKPPDIVIGSGPEMLKHLIEIRGVGVINVREVFGVRAIRLQKRVETVVELSDWDDKEDYERIGLQDQYTKFLGIQIPMIRLPIYPGKNITVIAETIALNQHLKVYGFNAAKELNKRLLKNMETKNRIDNYLRWDNE
ncbi:MAG: HPr(Ser) kinase/phosphatase [Calditrichaeota bacterium]|nr:HPr(Ser) kinase/phosphatase [Calditrichota bacterium]MBT7617154.1 HPr(Ser) kinase/phosphatase [Calditrichota bacterium]MBT7787926.1 HPr(Ser) kinase/phosphatase [Calditrichota bacterium]